MQGLMQVGARRIDFVNEGIDSIEVKMPPPRRMREAAMAVDIHCTVLALIPPEHVISETVKSCQTAKCSATGVQGGPAECYRASADQGTLLMLTLSSWLCLSDASRLCPSRQRQAESPTLSAFGSIYFV